MKLYDIDLSVLDHLFLETPAPPTPAKRKCKEDAQRWTTWFPAQPGFGLREYASGRKIYIAECPTPTGRRTITIGNANVLDRRTALNIARRCIYYSVGSANPADERKRIRRTPMFQDYLNDYWAVMYPQWKPASQQTEDKYRRLYLADAFLDKGVDEITYILSGLKRGKPTDRVFKGQYGGGICMDDYWHRIRGDAKLGKLRIHDIRHSYASLAARKSLPLPTIQRLLGHASLDSTARYTHFDDGHLFAIAQRISDFIEQASSA